MVRSLRLIEQLLELEQGCQGGIYGKKPSFNNQHLLYTMYIMLNSKYINKGLSALYIPRESELTVLEVCLHRV